MHVALVSGFWGQNIGNAFFNLGGEATLSAAGYRVSFVQDQPAYWTFRNEEKGSYDRAFSYVERLDVDLLVLQGPLFTRNFANIWGAKLARLGQSGIPWAVLGGAFRSYSSLELDVARQVFNVTPPLFVSTRDDESHRRLRSIFPEARSGIDSAFFMPQMFDPPKVTDSYVAMTFDHFLEPVVHVDRDPFDIEKWRLAPRSRLDALAGRSKAHAHIAQLIDWRFLPNEIGGRLVVRPDHRTNPHLPVKIYRHRNGVASDEPWTYAGIYAGAEATFSDRVHACVLSLAYGTPAQLHNPTTKRKALFDRVGVGDIEQRLCTLEPDVLSREFESVRTFLQAFI